MKFVTGNWPQCYTEVDVNKNPSITNDPRVYRVGSVKQSKIQKSLIRLNTLLQNAMRATDDDEELEELAELEKDLDEFKNEVRANEDELEDKTEDEKGIEELLKTNDADELEERRKSENEDSIEDEDEDVFKKRRIEGAKSVLEYKTASVDDYFKKLNYKTSVPGDRFLMDLGCGD